jgi:hypothetical protein
MFKKISCVCEGLENSFSAFEDWYKLERLRFETYFSQKTEVCESFSDQFDDRATLSFLASDIMYYEKFDCNIQIFKTSELASVSPDSRHCSVLRCDQGS